MRRPPPSTRMSAGRDWEGDADMKPEDIAAGCIDIARQLVEMQLRRRARRRDGRRPQPLPARRHTPTRNIRDKKGTRKDGRDLTQAWLDRYPGKASYIWNRAAFDALNPKTAGHVLALFEPSHMQFELDRAKDNAGEPSLAEMTAKAIDDPEAQPERLLPAGRRRPHRPRASRRQRRPRARRHRRVWTTP